MGVTASEIEDFTDLIRRVRAGDQAAAAELVGRYGPEVRREVRTKLRLRDSRLRRVFDSGDILQSVLRSFFLRVVSGEFEFGSPDQLCALLLAMARNKLAEQVRYQQRERRDVRRVDGVVDDQLPDAAADPSPSREAAGRDLLQAFHHRFTEEERHMADLRGEGRTWAEVAEAVGGTPEGRRKPFTRATHRVAVELGLLDLGVEA